MSEVITIKGLWSHIHLQCGCHDEEKVNMIVQSGPSSLFYSCPRYYPEYRKPGDTACANRINLIDFEEMINMIAEKLTSAQDDFEELNLSGWKFKNKKGDITFWVTKHDLDGEIYVQMKSRKALR